VRLREARVRETIRIRGALVWAERGLVPDFEIPVRLAGEVWPGELLQDGRPWPEPTNWKERWRQWMWRWHIRVHRRELERSLHSMRRAEFYGKTYPHPADPTVWPEQMLNPPPCMGRILPEGAPRISYPPVPPLTRPQPGVLLHRTAGSLLWRSLVALLVVLFAAGVVLDSGPLLSLLVCPITVWILWVLCPKP